MRTTSGAVLWWIAWLAACAPVWGQGVEESPVGRAQVEGLAVDTVAVCVPVAVAREVLVRSAAYPVLKELVRVQGEVLERRRQALAVAFERVEVMEAMNDSLRLTVDDLRGAVAVQRRAVEGQAREASAWRGRDGRRRWWHRLEGVAVGLGAGILLGVVLR